MTKAYEIVGIAKLKNGIDSDNAFAIRFGFRRQNVSDWKFGRSEPKGVNLLKLLEAADLSVKEAIVIMSESEKPLKEAGFTNLKLVCGIAGFSTMSLLAVSQMPYHAIGASLLFAMNVYYVKLDSRINVIFTDEIKGELVSFGMHEIRHFNAANDIQFHQVSAHSVN